jgi:hypothetical protein
MAATEPAPQPTRPWTGARTAAVVAAAFGLLAGAAMLLCALALIVAQVVLRDDDGFYSTPTEPFTTTSHALTAEGVGLWNVGGGGGGWLAERLTDRVRVEVSGTGDEAMFVGIAAERDLDSWLAGVAHDEVTDVRFGPFSFDAHRREGSRAPGRPGDQDFWAASASGAGRQTIHWEPGDGRWGLVVMNADGGRPVAADVSVGVKTGLALGIGLGLLGGGLLLVSAAGVALWLSLRERR